MRVLVDTAVFVYAVGEEHVYRDPCQDIVRRIGDRLLSAAITTDLLQEFVHQRTRRGIDRFEAVRQAARIPAGCVVLDVTAAAALAALELFQAHPGLDARDAVFAAVALEHGIARILSPDRAFDAVAGLTRVDPLDAGAMAGLGR